MHSFHPIFAFMLLAGCADGQNATDDDASTPDTPEAMVVVSPSDAPWITILQPSSLQAYEADSATLELSGEAAATAVEVTWTNDEAGTSGTVSGTETWSMILALERGMQAYTFTASDTAGREGTTSLEILYQPGVHVGWPELSTPVAMPGETITVGIDIQPGDNVSEAVTMVDCGKGAYESAMSEVWSGHWEASLTAASEEQTCDLWVEATVGNDEVRSLERLHKVREPIDDARAAEVLALQEELSAEVVAGLEDPRAAFEDAVAVLEGRDDIAMAGWTDNKLWWLTRDDMMFSVSVAFEDEGGGGPGAPPVPAAYMFPTGLGMGDLPEQKVYDFDAMEEPSAVGSFLNGELDGHACGAWEFTQKSGSSATVDDLEDSLHAGLVRIRAHSDIVAPNACHAAGGAGFPLWWTCGAGDGPFSFDTLEPVENDFVLDHWKDIKAYNIIVDYRVQVHGPAYDPSLPYEELQHPGITPGWINDHVATGQLDGSVVMMDSACSSAKNGSMWDVLAFKGAQAYVGFSDTVYLAYADAFLMGMLEAWFEGEVLSKAGEAGFEAVESLDDDAWTILEGMTTNEADPAFPRIFATNDLPSFGSMVSNGGFEDGGYGEADHWQHSDQAFIWGSVGGYDPAEGDRQLDLYLDPGASQAYAWATQEVADSMTAGTYTLSFDQRIVTEYSNVDCDNHSDPWFVIRIDPGGWTDLPNGGQAVFEQVPADFCTDLVQDDWLVGSGWMDTAVTFDLANDLPSGAYLTFMTGTSLWEHHHVLLDNVKLYEGDCGP